MTIDPHDARMETGKAAMAVADVLDEEALALLEAFGDALSPVVAHFAAKGLPPVQVAQLLVGPVLAVAWQEQS